MDLSLLLKRSEGLSADDDLPQEEAGSETNSRIRTVMLSVIARLDLAIQALASQ
jgi:hypothetical protein